MIEEMKAKFAKEKGEKETLQKANKD